MIAWCASGADEGLRAIRSKMPLDQGHPVVFPLRLAHKSQRWPAACLALMAFLSLMGVESNWLATLRLLLLCQPSQPAPLGAGSKPQQIRPWRYHSWQHIQNPETFLVRARPVLHLYEHAAALLEQGNGARLCG